MPLHLRLILYPVFALFCLLFFSYILFPFDSLKSRVEAELQRGLPFNVQIGKVSPAPFTGVQLKNVVLESADRSASVKIDRARLKLGLFSLLLGSKKVNVVVKQGKGRIEGSLLLSPEATEIDLEASRLDLSWGRLFLPKLRLSGSLNALVSLKLFPADPLRNTGKIALELPEVRVEEGGTVGGFPIPSLVLSEGSSRIDILVERGNWDLQSLKLTGGDLEFQATGKIFAARQFDNYRLNLRGDFAPKAGSESKLPFLSLLEAEKDSMGKYPISVSGRISKPAFRIGNFKVPI